MKRSLIFLLPAILALASCGTAAQYASDQLYPDGIYYRPQPPVQLYSEEDFRDMAARNLAADSLKTKKQLEQDYGYGYYSPYYYYSPYWGYRSYAWGLWADPWWDPYWDPWWGYGRYGYYGFYSPYSYYSYSYPYYHHYYSYAPYHPVYVTRPADYGASGYPGNYLTGGNNHRRAGSISTGGTSVAPSSVTYRRSSGSGSGTAVRSSSSSSSSSSGYRRSGSNDYTPRSSSSYSGSSSRSSYSSGSSYSGGSSHSSGGGYSGGSSHSGGSGGGGGGRR